jgi:hypothetical protein
VYGGDGEVAGLLACESDSTASQSDFHWHGDLDQGTPSVIAQPSPGYRSNGCEAGGRVYMPRLNGRVYQVQEFEVVGLLGDSVRSAGGSAEVTAFSPIKPTTALPDLTVVFLSSNFIAPLPIPGLNNVLGLHPGVLLLLGTIVHDQASGRGTLVIPSPTLPMNITLPVQGVTLLSFGTGPFHLTSTAGIGAF